jgi:hypothetical protein
MGWQFQRLLSRGTRPVPEIGFVLGSAGASTLSRAFRRLERQVAARARAVYRRLAEKYHPDMNPENAEVMREINELGTVAQGQMGTYRGPVQCRPTSRRGHTSAALARRGRKADSFAAPVDRADAAKGESKRESLATR